jgi:hypothetical protein
MKFNFTGTVLLLSWCAVAHAADPRPLTARDAMRLALDEQATLPEAPPSLPTFQTERKPPAAGKAGAARVKTQLRDDIRGVTEAQDDRLHKVFELANQGASHAADDSDAVEHTAAGQHRTSDAKSKAKDRNKNKDKGNNGGHGKGGNP